MSSNRRAMLRKNNKNSLITLQPEGYWCDVVKSAQTSKQPAVDRVVAGNTGVLFHGGICFHFTGYSPCINFIQFPFFFMVIIIKSYIVSTYLKIYTTNAKHVQKTQVNQGLQAASLSLSQSFRASL